MYTLRLFFLFFLFARILRTPRYPFPEEDRRRPRLDRKPEGVRAGAKERGEDEEEEEEGTGGLTGHNIAITSITATRGRIAVGRAWILPRDPLPVPSICIGTVTQTSRGRIGCRIREWGYL